MVTNTLVEPHAPVHAYVVWLPVDVVMTLLGNWRTGTLVALPVFDKAENEYGERVVVPADYVVTDATYDWLRKSIGVRIEHPSFPEVDRGRMPEQLYFKSVTVSVEHVG